MTKYHKFQQKGVGDLRDGRNENLTHDDRHLTTSNNRLGVSMQTPPLPSYNQVDLQQHPKGSPPSTPLSLMWQKEPANEKEKNVAMEQSLQPEKPKVKDVQTPLIQELVDFSLFENDHECPIAPLTPKSLSNSPLIPLMPAKPRPIIYESFDDSDNEDPIYDTTGFFPSLSSIERKSQN
ncbi:hypothetical protein C1646_778219 [Rhizophagus diaphanus]|nr:hypothetical protein C1646_778219 [Rhizophagus diaphanus] [Rhizophagus sp. MUCL 43196]